MSGGEKKKRVSRAHGWEEAKDEFYQESYPTDTDFEAFGRDPRKLTTLLPSKQTRAATANRRKYQKDGKGKNTMKKRTTPRNHYATGTTRRQSFAQDNYVAMMPDLSENLSNEETTWEEIMQIKSMPLSMAQKREIKRNLQSKTKLRLQGYEQFKWQRRKAFQQMKGQWNETYAKIGLWQGSLKQIEGKYGTGVTTYFHFIKWLMFLNLAMFGLMFCFVFLPTITVQYVSGSNETDIQPCRENDSVVSCSGNYSDSFTDLVLQPLDIIQGTGWVGNTVMFYGNYDCTIYFLPGGYFYNLPFAYVLVTLSTFILSLMSIVKSAAQGFKDRLVEGQGQFYQYCNLVFCGWDFCIQNERSAHMKHKALYNEMKSHLLEEKMEEERKQRTKEAKTKLMVIRTVVNVVVLLVLAGCGAFIYYSFSYSQEWLLQAQQRTDFEKLLLEYLPSIMITALNMVIPIVFRHLVGYERYSPMYTVRMTLLRTVFLRLASIIVLLSSIYTVVSCSPQYNSQCQEDGTCTRPLCWETYAGQQFYKLILLDFVTHLFFTFFFNFPRMLIARHSDTRAAQVIGEQQFELTSHVLDVIYSQTLCWLGTYYAPILPALAAVELFILFYVKKFACLVNCRAPTSVNLASRSKSMFMTILLLSFAVSVTPVIVSIADIMPSAACGPFRGEVLVWNVVVSAFETLPAGLQYAVFYFSTAGFAVPAFIILTIVLYYYYAVSQANKHMVTVLKNQLILEGHDKQFLLNRLSAFVKQQEQSRSKEPRSAAASLDVNSTTDNSNES